MIFFFWLSMITFTNNYIYLQKKYFIIFFFKHFFFGFIFFCFWPTNCPSVLPAQVTAAPTAFVMPDSIVAQRAAGKVIFLIFHGEIYFYLFFGFSIFYEQLYVKKLNISLSLFYHTIESLSILIIFYMNYRRYFLIKREYWSFLMFSFLFPHHFFFVLWKRKLTM